MARDARAQVEFNSDVACKYQLIGYENRAMADSDFRNDGLDSGEPGFARDVTALYELRLEEAILVMRRWLRSAWVGVWRHRRCARGRERSYGVRGLGRAGGGALAARLRRAAAEFAACGGRVCGADAPFLTRPTVAP